MEPQSPSSSDCPIVLDQSGNSKGQVLFKVEANIHDCYQVDPITGKILSPSPSKKGYVIIVKELSPKVGYTLGLKTYDRPGWTFKGPILLEMNLRNSLFLHKPTALHNFRLCFIPVTKEEPLQFYYCVEFKDNVQPVLFRELFDRISQEMEGNRIPAKRNFDCVSGSSWVAPSTEPITSDDESITFSDLYPDD